MPEVLIQPDLMDAAIDRDNCCRRLRRTLKRVPVKYRRTLVDHFVRGYSVKQIAKLHRIPLGTVLSRLFYGKRLLREAWEA
jgi:DNA-directed RNA polymerase specialized sigma24 family protein